jgi:protein SCO1/2
MHRLTQILVVSFVALGLAGGAFFTYLAFRGDSGLPEFATVLPQPMALPALSLVDDSGAAFTRDDFKGAWHLVFFGFTHCPDVCPATLQQLAIARDQVTAAGGTFPEIILVSVDPQRDTPDVMATYVGNFGKGVRGVTGSLDNVRDLTDALGIYFARGEETNGGYSVDHSAAVLVIDPQGDWHSVFSAPHSVERFVHDVPILTGAR